MGRSGIRWLFLSLLLFAFINIHIYSQKDWERLENLNGGNVRSVLITDDLTVIVGTEIGGMYKFDFPSENWNLINDSLKNDCWLIGEDFNHNLYTPGNWGGSGLIRSTDKGISWTATSVTRTIYSFKKDTVNNLILASSINVIYESSDNGLTWTEDIVSDSGLSIYSIDVNEEGTTFAATDKGLFRKKAGDYDWKRLNTPSEFSYFHYVKIRNNDLYLPIRQILYKSTDGGDSWNTIFSLNTYSAYMVSIVFVNDDNLFLAYDDEGIYKSTDGGETFVGANFSFPWLNFLEYDSARNCLIAGSREGISLSFNHGKDWEDYNEGLFNLRLSSLCIGKDDYLFAASRTNHGHIALSKDYGRSWEKTNISSDWNTGMVSDTSGNVYVLNGLGINKYDYTLGRFKYIRAASNTISSDRFGSVYLYYGYPGSIIRMKDGGSEVETILFTPGTNVEFVTEDSEGKLYAASTENGNTTFYRFESVNNSWTELLSLESTRVNDLDVDSHDNIYLACSGHNGLLKSTNSGNSWTEIALEAYDIAISPLDQIYITDYYNILLSSDGGGHWNSLTYPSDFHYISLAVTRRGNVYTGRDYDALYRYLDGASCPVVIKDFYYLSQHRYITLVWSTEDDKRNAGFIAERSADSTSWEDRGFVSGNSSDTAESKVYFIEDSLEQGEVYYYRLKQISTDSLISFSSLLKVETNFSEDNFSYKLYQNYPNPFNNSAVIRYSVPERSPVTLIIYDILGREVLTLLREEKLPGVYEIKFNADRLASGVYFYQLRAGDFVETKKMLLLR